MKKSNARMVRAIETARELVHELGGEIPKQRQLPLSDPVSPEAEERLKDSRSGVKSVIDAWKSVHQKEKW